MPKLDAFSNMMLACALLAVAGAVIGSAVLGQGMSGSCIAAGLSVRLGVMGGWMALTLAGGAACWLLLQTASSAVAALARGRARRASRGRVRVPSSAAASSCARAMPVPAASGAVLRFPSTARRRGPAGAPRPAGDGGQVVTLRRARFAPWRRPVAQKPPLEHECLGEC